MMKYLTGLIVALLLLVPAVMGANVMTQLSSASANGAGVEGTIDQNEMNAGLSIGANTITQTNTQTAISHDCFIMTQDSANLALALGTGNVVTQTNYAWANGGQTNQDQLNAVAVLGNGNTATQSNSATANELRTGAQNFNVINQSQSNLGLLIGCSNALTQTNNANAIIPKNSTEDPIINQFQVNIGVLISKCPGGDCPDDDDDEQPPCDCEETPDCDTCGWGQ
jgi:hypothetical protein